MPQLLSVLIRLIALLIGVLFSYVGLESPLAHWADTENTNQIYENAEREYNEIISSANTATTSSVLDAIKPNDDLQTLEEIIGTTTPVIPAEKIEFPIIHPKPAPLPLTPKPEPEPEPEPYEEVLEPVLQTNPNIHDPHSAVVRISCTKEFGQSTELLSGSGVLISPKGYLITNAHVGYFFTNNDYDCIITESENAAVGYKGEVQFISDSWLSNFEDDIENGHLPPSTGEHDLAIIKISESINPAILLPDMFPYIEVSSCAAEEGDRISTWGYPGTHTGNILDDIRNELVTDTTTVAATYSFDGGDVDVIETKETDSARQGSSGGGILFRDGTLAGVIVTTLVRDGDDVLTGLSVQYARRLLQDEGANITRYASYADSSCH